MGTRVRVLWYTGCSALPKILMEGKIMSNTNDRKPMTTREHWIFLILELLRGAADGQLRDCYHLLRGYLGYKNK